MPAHEGLRPNDGEDSQDRRKTAVKLEQKQSIEIREMDPALHLTAQHDHLVTERRMRALSAAAMVIVPAVR